MTPAESNALTLVETLRQTLAEQPGVSRTATLTKTMAELVDTMGEQAILPAWTQCLSADDATVQRTFSYILASRTETLEPWAWISLLWLVSSPSSQDESGVLNTLTTLQRHPAITGMALAALRPQIAPFLINAIGRSEVARESAIEAMTALADTGVLREVLSKSDAGRICELLAAASTATDRDGAAVIDDAMELLSSERYPDRLTDDTEPLALWLSAYTPRDATNAWTKLLSDAESTAHNYVARYASFESFAISADSRFAAYELRVTKHWADEGRVPYDFYQKLLSVWRKLYFSVRAELAPNTPEPSVFVLAPILGSFSTRVLVEPPADDREAEAAVADELSNRLASISGLGEDVSGRQEYAAFLDLISEHDINLEVGIASSIHHRVRARVVLSSTRARAWAASAARLPSPTGKEVTLSGTLDAANHRSGHFEIIPSDGSAPIKGTLKPGTRNALLRKVIGQQYTFRFLREGHGEALKWTLLGLHPVGPIVLEDEFVELPSAGPPLARPTKPIRKLRAPSLRDADDDLIPNATAPAPLAPIPDRLDSKLVPQVDNIAGMLQVVEILLSGRALSARTLGVSAAHRGRAVGYVTQAARVLNLIDESNALTADGARLGRLSKKRQVEFLLRLFERSLVGRAWMSWSKVSAVADLDPESASEFLEAKKLKPSMIKRRGRTLTRWARDLTAGALQPVDHRD